MRLAVAIVMLCSAEAFAAAPKTHLTAAQIADKNVAARGGLKAWRAVKTLQMTGKLDAGTGDSAARSAQFVQSTLRKRHNAVKPAPAPEPQKQVQLPFRLARARPNKSRLEIEFAGKTAVQVYDGAAGWKLRPFLNRTDAEPFTEQEKKSAAVLAGIDAPLVDYKARGAKLTLEGVEKLEGRSAYKLKLTAKDGSTQRVWIDTQTFLDVKLEGAPRRMDGKPHGVYLLQRDFRAVQGVKLPFVVETVVDGYPQSHRILVENVTINPKIDAAAFAKPRA